MYDTATLIDRHAGNQDKSVLLFMQYIKHNGHLMDERSTWGKPLF